MGLGELFTNKEKTKNDDVEISAPAFSVTKTASAVGLLVGGLLVAVPSSVKEHDGVVIASIAAGTLVMLGILALVAVDIRARQRAEAAKRRWPTEAEKKGDAADSAGKNQKPVVVQIVSNGGNGQERPEPHESPAATDEPKVLEVSSGTILVRVPPDQAD